MRTPSYTLDQLKEAVSLSVSFCEVCRRLGVFHKGASWENVKARVEKHEIDTSHFLGKASFSGPRGPTKKQSPEEILTVKKYGREKTKKLRRALLESGLEHKCSLCGLGPVWMGREIVLEIDHVDRNKKNCVKENLRFLCPNCHSQETVAR